MPKLFRVLAGAFIALGGIPAVASVANAQTKPLVTTLGPDFPKTEIFIDNSVFYNNSMHSHVLAMQRAADPAGLDAQTTAFLQNIAWDAVQEYYGK